MDYVDQVFEGGTVSLDGNNYTRCTFRNVVLKYAGGPLEVDACTMERFAFQFDGDLARGLHSLHQILGTERMLTMLRNRAEGRPDAATQP